MIAQEQLPEWIRSALLGLGLVRASYEGGLIELEFWIRVLGSGATHDAGRLESLASVADSYQETWFAPELAALGCEAFVGSGRAAIEHQLRTAALDAKKHAKDAESLAEAVAKYRDQTNIIDAARMMASFQPKHEH